MAARATARRPSGAQLRQLRQGFGALQAVERRIAGAQIEIDVGEIRMRLRAPGRLDDLRGAPQVAPAGTGGVPARAAAGTRSGASFTASWALDERALPVALEPVEGVGGVAAPPDGAAQLALSMRPSEARRSTAASAPRQSFSAQRASSTASLAQVAAGASRAASIAYCAPRRHRRAGAPRRRGRAGRAPAYRRRPSCARRPPPRRPGCRRPGRPAP